MSAPAAAPARVRPVRAPLPGVERICLTVGAVLIGAGLFHLLVFAVDGGPWYGPVSWRKPVTFGLSFGLTLMTVVRASALLPLGERLRAGLLAVFAADCVVEVGGITVQAWRHRPSHLDMETPVDTAVSMTLAVGGAVLVAVLGVMAVTSFRSNPRIAPSMRLALRAGSASLLVGLASGAAMVARGAALVRGGHQQEAYHAIGYLKTVHAVSLHGILVLPALAWLLGRLDWDETRRTRAVALAATAWAAAVAGALAVSLW
ncbi:hypothetical protein [Peterkaempfera sp. SMS 1(5)a]|uniref:hypothetical protein n=1 Tax=Peterkaempfera podocarpi TaxID=3232308 RepID=UPI0036718BB7